MMRSAHPIDILGRMAEETLPPAAWAYLMGAAGRGRAAERNIEDWQRYELLPHLCHDVHDVRTEVELFGRRLPHPIVVAPSAFHRLFHPDAEHATAAGAEAAGAPFVISMEASTDWSEITISNLWCQISPQRDAGVTRDLVARAEAAGAKAIVLTLDTPVSGARYQQRREMPELPSWLTRPNLPAGPGVRDAGSFTNPGFTWRDVAAVAEATSLPVVGKGILRASDARLGIDAGLAGIGVSNHGGRNLEAVPSTARRLASVAAEVAGEVPVLVDGGVRSGDDVVKALALGATAVMLARPVLWGLAARGAAGVQEVLDTVHREVRETLALCGVSQISDLPSDLVVEATDG